MEQIQISTAAELLLKQNATADRAARMAAAAKRADTTTPLATIPEPPQIEAKAGRKFALSTIVDYRGRAITIHAEGMTLDQFCDLLDDRGYASPTPQAADPTGWQTLPDGTPICPKHRTPMRKRERQGDQWWSHNAGTKDAPLYCKGYHAPDSPGYDVE